MASEACADRATRQRRSIIDCQRQQGPTISSPDGPLITMHCVMTASIANGFYIVHTVTMIDHQGPKRRVTRDQDQNRRIIRSPNWLVSTAEW